MTDLRGDGRVWRVGTLTYTLAGLLTLFAWLLWGDFAWAMKDRSIGVVFQSMLKKYGASDMLTGGLVGSLPAVIGMVLGPIVGYKSDRYRGRWGRRIPFLLFTLPFTVLSMIGLGLSPWIGTHLNIMLGPGSPGVNPCVLISFGVCWTLFDFASAIAGSVLGGLINDVVPQAVVGRFFGMFRAVSLIAGIIFNYWVMGSAESHYQWIFIGFGLFYGIGFSITCFRVKEGQYPPPPVIPAREGGGFLPAATGYLKDCFGRGYYVWSFVGPALALAATLAVNLFTVFYAKSIGMSMDVFGKCIALTYGISLLLAYPLGWLADAIHPLRLVLVVLGIYAITLFLSGIYARDPFTFSIALIIHGVISGAYFTASASLGQRLLPNAKFAELGSAGGLVASAASFTVGPLVGLFLDHANHVYRYTFFIAAGLTSLSVIALFVLHSKFVELGGANHYVAPE